VVTDRRFDDRQASLILKRVAELHEHASETATSRSMTKTDIEQAVAELGISTSLVTRAISELSLQDLRNRPNWWLGGKTDVMLEEIVQGRIDEATFTLMVELMRRSFGDPGELKVEGAARIWSTHTTARPIHLSVVETAETTTLRLEESMEQTAHATVGAGAATGGFSGFLLVIPLNALVTKLFLSLALGPLAAVGATIGWLSARALWSRRSAAREDQLRQVFAELLEIAASRSRQLPAT
jgi:hypothetical protein